MTTDDVAARHFCENFRRMEEFYEDLHSLCCRYIPEEVSSLGYTAVEGSQDTPIKIASRLLCTQAKSQSPDDPGMYLPDPVFVRLKGDPKPDLLVAAFLSPRWAAGGEPMLLVVPHRWKENSAGALAKSLIRVFKDTKAGTQIGSIGKSILVPLKEFGRGPDMNESKLRRTIHEKIVRPLKDLPRPS
jgi:hypothetical protein